MWLTISFFIARPSFGQDPFIPKYDAVKRSERCFTVTPEANNKFGAVWWADKVDFSNDTLFNFVVYMGNLDGNGADGLAFVMHQDPRDITTDASQQVIIDGAGTWDLEAATGDDGGGLGFARHESREGPNTIPGPHGPGDDPENHKIQKSVAIEMDTYNNNDVPDGSAGLDGNLVNQATSPYSGWDHTAVIYNGDLYSEQQLITDAQGNTGRILPIKPAYAFGGGNNPDGTPHHNLEDDRCYTFQVRWEVLPDGTQNLELWAGIYNGTTDTDDLFMIMTHNDDMINNVFGGDPVMRFGFTGSTGGAINEQTICLLGENSKPFAQDDSATIPLNTTAIIDVESNDNDPDGDELHVPIVVDPAKHGLATIFDSLNINYMRYTPNTNYVGLDTIGYITCDVNSTKCYAKCDTAYVFIEVGCILFDVDLIATSPNTVCSDSVPTNGAAEASVDATFMRGTLWYEGFEGDVFNGDTNDNGTTAWTSSSSGGCNPGSEIQVETINSNNLFRVKASGCDVRFVTEIIDISGLVDVGVSIDLQSAGDLENSDYLEVYYKLDGGAETQFINGIHHTDFGTALASINGLNGSTLQIVIRAKNTGGDENYYWDNIHVTAIGAGVPDVTFNWYDGATPAGPITYTGSVNNGISHGTYTVVALDNATGCSSNPATITIDSAGFNVPGGFIEQIAPFTNCKLPYDGALEAGIISGPDTLVAGYSFEWYYQEDPKTPFFLQSTGAAFSNLESREYAVIITEMASGCDTTINEEVVSEVIIPTVTAATLADIISCSDPNTGSGEASVGGITSGYDFEWYIGPAIGAGPADYTTPTVNTFPAGTFTVHAIDTITSCASESRSITINDQSVLPDVLITVVAEQTSCDTLALTGEYSGAVNEAGVSTTTGYSFNWYKGPNDIIPARSGYVGGPIVDSLEAGMYRLVVVQDITNCTSFVDTLIQDITITPPDITLTTVDVTSCAISNGSVTINVVGNVTDYIYDIYSGFGAIPDSLLMTSTSNVITDLPVGNYTVIAKDIITKCETNPVTTTINDASVLPTTTIISQDQISCDSGNPTGQLTASVGVGTITDYSLLWFENDTSGLPIAASSVDGEIISDLDSGSYALSITHNTSQCTNVFYPSVNIGIVLPLEVVSAVPSTNCGITANGQLVATVDGGLTEVDGFTFIWESVDNADTLSATTATVTSLEPGDYLLTVINDTTTCASNPAPVTVDDNTIIPDPIIALTANSSCDSISNGEVLVSGINNEANPLTDYHYTWYDGNSSGALLVASFPNAPDSSRIAGLTADTIALVITNSITTCSNEVLSIINNVNIKPIIDGLTVDHVDNCITPYNSGSAIVSVNGGLPIPVGFTFEWINLDGGPAIMGNNSSISDNDLTDEVLPPGNYQVTAYNEYGCPSDIYTFTIDDNAVPPTFSLAGYNNISCDVNFPEGSLLASRPNTSYAISTYEWFENNTSGTLLSTTSPVDSILYSLDSGTYAVRITDGLTGCTSVEYASIQNAPANAPIIQNIANVGLTSCINPNGKLGYRVIPFENEPPLNTNPRTYTFYLDGSASYNQTNAGSDSTEFINLSEGDWNAWVVDEFAHCISDTIQTTMADAPEIAIIADAVKLPSSCIGTDGELNIFAETLTNDSISGGLGFNFDWFRGADGSQGGVSFTSAANNFFSTADSLTSDYYLVSIVDIETGCTADTAVYIPSITLPEFMNVNITPTDRCEPFSNGSVSTELNAFPILPIARGYSDYHFILFEGPTFNTSWQPTDTSGFVHSISTPAGGPVVFPSDLKEGMYTLVVKEDFGDCFSDPLPVQIDLNFVFPEMVTAIQVDNSCSAAPLGTGQLEILSTFPVIPLTDFSFEWFIGANSAAVGAQTPATLFSNNYTIIGEITANVPGQGCIGDSLFRLPKVLDTLEIIENVMPNRNCVPYDGAIQFTDIEENGSGVGLPGNYVNFNIFDADLVAFTPASGDGVATPWGGISPGNYYLQAQHDITKCLTEIIQVTVDDLAQDPVLSIVLNNLDYGCNVGAATGELEAFATAGSQNTAEYNFTWYQGAISDPVISNVPIASNITANSSTQLYTIEIEDTVGANQGCVSTKEYTLLYQPTTVSILGTQMTLDPQRNCGPSGSIVLNQINEDDGSGPIPSVPDYTGAYDAQLLDINLNAINPVANPYAEFFPINGEFGTSNIPAGTYYVQASNSATACAYGPVTQVIINDVSKNPIISAILDSPDYSCVGGTATGQLTATAIGGFDGDNVQSNFDITWLVKSSGATVPGGAIAANLSPDAYTLVVIDTSGVDIGCSTTRDYVVTTAKHDIDMTASALDQTICIPDGSAQIETITVDGSVVGLPNAGWSALLFDNNRNDITPALPETGFAGTPFINMSEGVYFIQAQDTLTLCYSDPFQVSVRDVSVNPVIAIDVTTPQYSLNPNPASWTGAMQATVTEIATGVPDPNGYVYAWHAGTNDVLPSISNLDNVSATDVGYYTLIAVSNSTGCESRYYKYMPYVYLESIFNTSITPQTICSPYDGSIEVTDISLDGAPDMLSDFTFNWHHDTFSSGDVPDAIIPGDDVRTAYDNINAGNYYIIAKENWWMIDSYPLKVEVIDSTTNPIINFDATSYKALTSCDENVIANGALAVNVYEDNTNANLTPPFNYEYTWYTGSNLNPANLIPGETNSSISGLPSGKYSVVVVNLGNFCQAQNTFTIEDESTIPLVVGSQTPNTNCPIDIANGISSAKVINSKAQYDYEWYSGTDISGAPAYIGANWKGRQVGYYTVVAVDLGLSTCISEPVIIQVEDATEPPIVLINELSPVTHCDPNRPNGVLSALTQDGINGHSFEWYLNETLMARGPVASKLGLFDYQLLVTNDVTQCITAMNGSPTQLLSTVPLPNVDILNDRTSCLAPDGIATASISGNVTDYIFRYYKKADGDELSNTFEDYTIYDLDTSTYQVTAENRITGCISDPTEFAISNESYFPEIDIIVDPSNCLEPSGAANVIISDITQEYKVTWYGENEYEEQLKEIVYIPVGKYRVEVEGSDGCITSTEAEIKGDVLIYNGVSANYDGLNDFFKVVCLEYFPDNNVKIYSRSGLMVYEQDSYDMNDVTRRFEGVSNKGANLLGTELPIGTYFYIVNKNDGSEPKVGYLELLR